MSFRQLEQRQVVRLALVSESHARDSALNRFLEEHVMHLSLGGIVKGITTGLETLAETGNPAIAAGVGAVACLTDNGGSASSGSPASASTPVQTFNPLLDQLSAESPAEQQNVNALSSFASQQSTDLTSLIDGDGDAA